VVKTLVPLVCVALAVVAPSGSADAATRPGPAFETIATASGAYMPGEPRLLSSGGRYLHWFAVDGTSTTLDTKTGATRAGLVPTGCDALAIGGGELLYRCDEDPAERIVDITTGERHDIVAAEDLRNEGDTGAFLVGVGRQWVSGDIVYLTGHTWDRVYLNWHTGEMVSGTVTGRSIADLNLPGLRRPMCRPFKRPEPTLDERELRPQDYAYQYERPFRLTQLGRRQEIVLSRCGHRRGTVLARVRNGGAPGPGPLRDGIVTWQGYSGGSGAYLVATKRRYVWPEYNIDLTHGGDYAFRVVKLEDGNWAVQRARLRP
jgi:hypothetical protein